MTDVLKSFSCPRDVALQDDERRCGSILSSMIDSIEDGSIHIGVCFLLQAMLFIPVEAESYKCIFVQCEQTCSHPISMIRHLLECRLFIEGGAYHCYKCNQQHILERFVDIKRSDAKHKPRKNIDYKESVEAPQRGQSTSSTTCNPSSRTEVPQEQEQRVIPKGRISQIKEEEWEKRKKQIRRLYITEGASLSTVMRTMEMSGFHATIKQYKLKLKEWEFRKYCKPDERELLLEKIQRTGPEYSMRKKLSPRLSDHRFRSQKMERPHQSSLLHTDDMISNSKASKRSMLSHAKDKAAELQTPQISEGADVSPPNRSTTGSIPAMQKDRLRILEHGVEPSYAGAISETTSIYGQELDPPSLSKELEIGLYSGVLDPGSRNSFEEAYSNIQTSRQTDESILSEASDYFPRPPSPLNPESMQRGIDQHDEFSALPEDWRLGEPGYNYIYNQYYNT